VHYFQLRELLVQALGKPCGSLPHSEAVMKDDEKLHAKLS